MGEKRIYFATKALIVKEDKFLAMHKSNADHSLYELPGGRLEFGESAEETLSREIREETGLTVEPLKILDTWNYLLTDLQIVGIIYLCRITEGNLRLSDEHDRYEWLQLGNKSLNLMHSSFAERMLKWDFDLISSIVSNRLNPFSTLVGKDLALRKEMG